MHCMIAGCDRTLFARGWCNAHYQRARTYGSPEAGGPFRYRRTKCSIGGCLRDHYGSGYCAPHFKRFKRYGDPLGGGPFRARSGRPRGWSLCSGYRKQSINGKQKFEHRLVMESTIGRKLSREESVHHKNGDRLDNRPSNLELWSSSQPPGQRIEDKVQWAYELIAQYEPVWLGIGC